MTRFRPCIDLHAGQVKQIVGGTLTTPPTNPSNDTSLSNPSTTSDHNPEAPNTLKINYISPLPSSHFATLYKTHYLTGAHVIMLGSGNEDAGREALAAWPGALQVGGGITDENCAEWIGRGAEKVCPRISNRRRHSHPTLAML